MAQVTRQQRPVVDLVVALLAVPTLIVFALQLEKNMQSKWTEETATRWIVLGLGIGMLLISLLICGYVTHRMGVCLWTGPIDDPNPVTPYNHQNDGTDICHADNLPPSYESVVKYDLPPPPYDWVIINIETKDLPKQDIAMHI